MKNIIIVIVIGFTICFSVYQLAPKSVSEVKMQKLSEENKRLAEQVKILSPSLTEEILIESNVEIENNNPVFVVLVLICMLIMFLSITGYILSGETFTAILAVVSFILVYVSLFLM